MSASERLSAQSIVRLVGDPCEQAAIGRLRASLVDQAASEGLLDIAYRTLDTPIGALLLAATPSGLLRVAFAREGHDQVIQALTERVSPRVLLAPAKLDLAAREMEEYFSGTRKRFGLRIDMRLARGFRRAVLREMAQIAYGTTVSYSDLAAAAGSPRAVRAVGTACATNPLPIVLPCHRVLRSDGTLGGYGGGLDAKRALLALEASGASER